MRLALFVLWWFIVPSSVSWLLLLLVCMYGCRAHQRCRDSRRLLGSEHRDTVIGGPQSIHEILIACDGLHTLPKDSWILRGEHFGDTSRDALIDMLAAGSYCGNLGPRSHLGRTLVDAAMQSFETAASKPKI